MRAFLMTISLLMSAIAASAHPTNVGFSGGQPGRQTCAMSCHGADGASISLQGFPATYIPGNTYTLNIFRVVGDPISNFNVSVRIGTTYDNAGVLEAGTATSTYNVAGETNGVHFTDPDQVSGSFTWTAPAPGTGTVRLYGGAHQGSNAFGPNTEFLRISEEIPGPPGLATDPTPADSAIHVPLNVTLSWTPDTAATSHDVNFGLTNPPDSVANTIPPVYALNNLLPETVYYWRIDERNDAGVTIGPVWRFTTVSLPGAASHPQPADGDDEVPVDVVLSWSAGLGAESHNVYFGLSQPPEFRGNRTDTTYDPTGDLASGMTYYWRIDEINTAGLTPGSLWHFTVGGLTAGERDVHIPEWSSLGPIFPNPFNATVTISYDLATDGYVSLRLFSLLGGQTVVLADGHSNAGTHRIMLDAGNLAAGIYFARLEAGTFSQTKKLLLLK